MDTIEPVKEAEIFEELLPKLMRRLFSLDSNQTIGDLTLAQLRLCGTLQRGARTMSDISDELGISVSAVTQLVDRLEESGLVSRTFCKNDRRAKELNLTTFGWEIMNERKRKRVDNVLKTLLHLTPEERQSALISLNALIKATEYSQNPMNSKD
jgi:DNA-binding MarR family transcriptional regulator